MRPTVRRCLFAAAVSAVLVPASAFGSTTVNPGRAARACAAGRAIHGPLGARSDHYLARFVPCVLEQERGQSRLGYTQGKALSRLVYRALGRIVDDPDLTPQDAADALGLAVKTRTASLCPHGTHARWAGVYGDTASHPGGTPLEFARLLGSWLTAPGAPGAGNAVFGAAAHSGATSAGGSPQGAVFGVVALVCAKSKSVLQPG